MASSWILKFPSSDESQNSVLVQVSRTGQSDLDLTLLATDGVVPYKVKVRQRKLKDLRAKNYNGTDKEWADLLRYVLISKDETAISDDQKRGLDVVAEVTGDDPDCTLTITLRNRIGDITQRLGAIAVPQTDDEIQLFDWTVQTVDKYTSSETKLASMRAKSDTDQAKILSLQSQLEDLVKAKAEHEDELISKFVVLLNEKKLKIRNQQRLLSMANVDKRKLEEMQLALYGRGRRPESSSTMKRRADDGGTNGDGDSSDEFESMEVEPTVHHGREVNPGDDSTPETETASEDEISADIPRNSPSPGPELPLKALEASSPPPQRILPFAKKGDTKASEKSKEKSPEPQMMSDEETASEDDEL